MRICALLVLLAIFSQASVASNSGDGIAAEDESSGRKAIPVLINPSANATKIADSQSCSSLFIDWNASIYPSKEFEDDFASPDISAFSILNGTSNKIQDGLTFFHAIVTNTSFKDVSVSISDVQPKLEYDKDLVKFVVGPNWDKIPYEMDKVLAARYRLKEVISGKAHERQKVTVEFSGSRYRVYKRIFLLVEPEPPSARDDFDVYSEIMEDEEGFFTVPKRASVLVRWYLAGGYQKNKFAQLRDEKYWPSACDGKYRAYEPWHSYLEKFRYGFFDSCHSIELQDPKYVPRNNSFGVLSHSASTSGSSWSIARSRAEGDIGPGDGTLRWMEEKRIREEAARRREEARRMHEEVAKFRKDRVAKFRILGQTRIMVTGDMYIRVKEFWPKWKSFELSSRVGRIVGGK